MDTRNKMSSKANKTVSHQPNHTVGNAAMLQLIGDSTRAPVIQLTAKEANPHTQQRYNTAHASGAAGVSEIQNKLGQGQLTGTHPTTDPMGWNMIPAHARGLWIRFHMINQQIGGLGQDNNLVPTSQATNHDPDWRAFEIKAQNEYNMGKWIWCKVEVTGYHATNPGFPSDITGLLESYNQLSHSWEYKWDVDLNVAAPPNFQTGVIRLGNMTPNDWKRVFGASNVTAVHVGLADLFRNQHYATYDEFDEVLFGENAPDIHDIDPIYDAIIGRHPTVGINIF